MDRWLRRFLGALIVYLMVLGGVRWILSNAFGPPADRTGSPGDGGVSCTACHTGPAGNSANVTLSGLPSSYTPGQAYSLTLTVGSAGGKRGFEIVSERDSNNAAVGSWSSLGSGVQTNGDSLSHQSASSNNSWTFTWTAPNPGVAGITFYIAGNVADGLGSTSGDQINLRSYAVPQAATPAPAITGVSPAFGSVGANITLTGTDFTSTLSTVNFSGGTSTASVVSWADTSIVTKATGSASGNVTVTNANGTSGGASFTLITGAPSLSSATPQAVDRASGSVSIRVSGANLSPGSTVKLSTTTPGVAVSSAAASGVALTTSTQITTATFNLSGMVTGYWTLSVTNPDASSGSLAGALLVQIRPDAPQSLQALILSSTAILWSWTAVGGNADTVRLYTSTGGAASPALSPPTSTYLESLYSPNEAALRSIAAFNAVGSSNSAVLTTATFANAPVSAASTFTLVGVSSAVAAWGNGGNTSGTQYTALLSTRTPLTLTDAGLLAVTTAPSGSPSAPFSNLTPDTSYYLFVRAINRQGGDTAYTALGSTVTYPAEPASAASTFSAVGITSMTASWNANGNPGGTLYETILSTATPLITTNTGNISLSTRPEGGPSGLFGGLSAASTYHLFVRAVGRMGAPTPYSSLGSTYTAAAEPGSAASTFSAVAVTSMTASWDANGNPAGTRYEAIFSTATSLITTNAGNVALSTRPEGSPSGLFTGLSADSTYYFFARAFGPGGVPTGYAALGSTASLADKPSASTVTAVSSSAITLAWGGGINPSDTLYEVSYSSVDAFLSGAFISTAARASGTAASVGGLAASTTYYLRVRALNRRGVPTDFNATVSTLTAPPLPAVPGTPSGASLGVSSISWSWAASTYALSYEVYYASSGVLLASPASPAFTQTGLSTNTAYGIKVRGINATGASPLSAAATTYSAAAQPGQPSVSGRTSNSISLGWDASGNPSGTRYEVSLSTDDFALNFSTPVPLSSNLSASATTFGGLQLGATYYARVRAFNGNSIASGFSSRVSTLTLNFPDPPSGLAAAALSSTTLLWTWTDASSDEAGFRVYSATAGKVSPDLASNTTFWLQTGLSADASAQNRVVSFAQGGAESPASAAVRRFTLARIPLGGSALPVASSSVSLHVSWSSGGASGFSLERATASAGTYAETASSQTLSAQATSYLDQPLSASTTYFYRLRAYNGDGAATDYGTVFSTRTHPSIPAAPSLSGAALSSTSIRWSWSAVAGVEEYALKTGTGALILSLSAGATEALESGLQPGAVYARLLTASNPVGLSTSAAASVATPQTALAVPAASSAAFTVAGASLSIPSGWLPGAGSVLASADPLNKPLTPTVAVDVSNANAALGFLKAVPSSLRQFLAYEGTTRREMDFLAAVTLSLEYPDADGNGIVDGTQIGADTLAVYFLREGGSSWTKLSGGSVDKANRRVSAPTTHFTLFTLAGGAAASDISGVRVFPNPLRPGLGHSNMTFRLLPASARVRIYTLAGERVADLEGDASGVAQWDGRNSSGRSAASGVYLAVVEGNGEKRTLKVAIQK